MCERAARAVIPVEFDIQQTPSNLRLVIILIISTKLRHLVRRERLRYSPRPRLRIDGFIVPVTFHSPQFHKTTPLLSVATLAHI